MFSIKAIFPIVIFITVSFAILMANLFKLSEDKSAKYCFYASILVALGMVLTLARDIIPLWIAYPGPLFFSLFGWCLFYVSLEYLILGKGDPKLFAILCGVYVIIFTFLLDNGYVFYASLFSSLVWSAMNIYLTFKTWKLNSAHPQMSLMTWLYAIAAISWAIRVLLANDAQLPLIHQHGFLNWATMVINFLLLVIRQVNYLIIRYDMTNKENVQIRNLLVERESLISGLMKANKTAATGALSASIAHELNQPLGASNLNIQFLKLKLKQNNLSPEIYEEVLSALDSDNKRAAQIVKSLRSIFSDDNSLAEKIDLRSAVSRVLNIVRPEFKSKGIQLELKVRSGSLIKINSNEIEQVILNLVNNSIQSLMRSLVAHPQITIEMYENGESVCLSVADNGEGIGDEFKPSLFQLLTTTKKTGMGLGLWLCKHIITRYGGSIWYEDVASGGAKFIIQLPRDM